MIGATIDVIEQAVAENGLGKKVKFSYSLIVISKACIFVFRSSLNIFIIIFCALILDKVLKYFDLTIR